MRIKELESELTNVDENKAQIDRYKQLLLKQRDIMIALTSRLNEWAEQILYLQEELQAYDQHWRQLEDALDHRTAELISIRKSNAEINRSRKEGTETAQPESAAAKQDVNGWHLYIYISKSLLAPSGWDDQEIKEDIIIKTMPKESHACMILLSRIR